MPDITYNQFPISGKIVDFDTLQNDVNNLNANAVLESRTINGYDLSENRTIYAQDVPSKNLCPNSATSKTESGITMTVNSDGSITVSGTASARVDLTLGYLSAQQLTDMGSAILTGCPSGGSASTYKLRIQDTASPYAIIAQDTGSGNTLGTPTTERTYEIYISISSGTAISTPITFYPMIRLASVTDDTYVPYAKTNVELTKETNTAVFEIKAVNGVTIKRNGSRYINSKTVHIICRLQITSAISNAKIIEFPKQATGVGIVIPIFSSTAEWGAPDVIQYGYIGAGDVVGSLSTSYPYVTIDTIIDLV